MDGQVVGYLLLGFALRFGIPLAVTALLVHLLHRLDARWQAEARAEEAALQGDPAAANGRCWEIRQCTAEERLQCAAYMQHDKPCWQVYLDRHGRLKDECLQCEVFHHAPVPVAA